MPQLQSIVLKDRAPTPVAHTFVPLDIKNDVGYVVERGASPIGNAELSISLRKVTGSNRYVATMKLNRPTVVVETVNGVSTSKIQRVAYGEAVFKFEETSTETERNDFVGMFADAFATSQTLVNDTIVKLTGVY